MPTLTPKAWALAYPFPGITSASKAVRWRPAPLFLRSPVNNLITMEPEHRIRVAVADDHTAYRNALCHHLHLLGFEVVFAAENGAQLINALEILAVPPSVCIIDMNMPVVNGATAARQIKSKWHDIKILAMSMDISTEQISNARCAGADAFLEKGCDPEHLKTLLYQLSEKQKQGP